MAKFDDDEITSIVSESLSLPEMTKSRSFAVLDALKRRTADIEKEFESLNLESPITNNIINSIDETSDAYEELAKAQKEAGLMPWSSQDKEEALDYFANLQNSIRNTTISEEELSKTNVTTAASESILRESITDETIARENENLTREQSIALQESEKLQIIAVTNAKIEGIATDLLEIAGQENLTKARLKQISTMSVEELMEKGLDRTRALEVKTLAMETLKKYEAANASKALAVAQGLLTMGLMTLAGIGISLVAKGIDYLIHKQEKLQETFEKSFETYQQTINNLESINSELETTAERISELEKLKSAGEISVADETELELLKETNKELERKRILEEQNKVDAAKNVLDNLSRIDTNVISWYQYSDSAAGTQKITANEELKLANKHYEELIQKRKELQELDQTSEVVRQIQNLDEEIASTEGHINSLFDDNAQKRLEAYKTLDKNGYQFSLTQREEYDNLLDLQDAYLMYCYVVQQTEAAYKALNNEQKRTVLQRRLIEQGFSDEEINAILSGLSDEDLNLAYTADFNFEAPSRVQYRNIYEYGRDYAKAWVSGAKEEISDSSDKFYSDIADMFAFGESILQEEYDKISDWGLEKYAAQIKGHTLQSIFGNVDMDRRTIIEWSDELKETYKDALESWEYDPEIGSVDTVFGGSDNYNGIEVAFTPIMVDRDGNNPQFLDKDTVDNYINEIITEATNSNGEIDRDVVLAMDNKGRLIGNQFVRGIIAEIGDNAIDVGSLMHFSGEYGAIALAEKNTFANIKNDLIGLSQAGKLDVETLKQYKYFDLIIKNLGKDSNVTDEYLESMIDTINSMAQKNPVDYLNNYRQQLNKLSDAYIKFKKGERINTSDLSELQDAFGDLYSYQEFEKAILRGEKELQKYFDAMATEMSGNVLGTLKDVMDVTDGLTEEDRDFYIEDLTEMGISNAEEVVDEALKTIQKYRQEVFDALDVVNTKANEIDTKLILNENKLTDATYEQIESVIKQTNSLDESTAALQLYALSKIKAEDLSIMNTDDLDYLAKMCAAADITTESLVRLANSKAALANIEGEIERVGKLDVSVYGDKKYTRLNELNNEAELLKKDIEKYSNRTQAEIQKELEKKYQVNMGVQAEFNGSDDLRKQLEDDAKSAKETFDWIEVAISRLERTITNLGKLVSATYRNWSTRNNALAQEINKVNEQIQLQVNDYAGYMDKANSIGLSDFYKNLVQNGGIRIEDITDETLKEQIKSYQEWYEKALAASDAIEDLRANLADLAKTKFDNISNQFNEQISVIQHSANMYNTFIDQAESAGMLVSEAYYKSLIDNQEEQIDQLTDKYSSLLSAFDEAVKSGAVEKYSEQWYEMYEGVNEVEEAVADANAELIKLNQTLQQLSWNVFDRMTDSISGMVGEANFIEGLMEYYGTYDRYGNVTNYGLTAEGLRAQNYNTYMEQAAAYAQEVERIKNEIENDPYDLELQDRLKSLTESQRDAINNAIQEKQVIVSLIKDGYDKMLDYLDELINKRKEALQAEKDMYDYEKNINEQTKSIASYRKQLLAYAGDNSEEAKSTIQKLSVSLSDAEEKLRETEYDKWKSDQEQMLDEFYSETEEWINRRLDNIDGLVAEVVNTSNANKDAIVQAMDEVGRAYGYDPSPELVGIWSGTKDAVGMYGDLLYGVIQKTDDDLRITTQEISDKIIGTEGLSGVITDATTGVQDAIGGISVNINNMIQAINSFAQSNASNIAALQNAVINGQKSDISSTPSQSVQATISNGGNTPEGNKETVPEKSLTETKDISSHKYDGEIKALEGKANSLNHIITSCQKDLASMEKDYASAYNLIRSGGGSNRDRESADAIVKRYNDKKTEISENQKELEEVLNDLRHLRGYRVGSKRITHNQLAWTQEEGQELIFRASDGAMLTPLGPNDKVFTAKQADNLWNMSKSPNIQLKPLSVGTRSGNMTNNNSLTVVLPNAQNYEQFKTQMMNDKQIERFMQSVTIDRSLGKNSLSKFK